MADREKTAIVDLKVRMKESLRVQIEYAAKAKGVSLNAEAAARLEQSFDHRPLHAAVELAFGRELGGMLLLIGQSMAMTRDLPKLFDVNGAEPWIYDQMVQAAEGILETFRPTEGISQPVLPRYSNAGAPADQQKGAADMARLLNTEASALLNAGVLFANELLSELTSSIEGEANVTRDLIGQRLLDRARAKK